MKIAALGHSSLCSLHGSPVPTTFILHVFSPEQIVIKQEVTIEFLAWRKPCTIRTMNSCVLEIENAECIALSSIRNS